MISGMLLKTFGEIILRVRPLVTLEKLQMRTLHIWKPTMTTWSLSTMSKEVNAM